MTADSDSSNGAESDNCFVSLLFERANVVYALGELAGRGRGKHICYITIIYHMEKERTKERKKARNGRKKARKKETNKERKKE